MWEAVFNRCMAAEKHQTSGIKIQKINVGADDKLVVSPVVKGDVWGEIKKSLGVFSQFVVIGGDLV